MLDTHNPVELMFGGDEFRDAESNDTESGIILLLVGLQ
jgi:hypothetical protein